MIYEIPQLAVFCIHLVLLILAFYAGAVFRKNQVKSDDEKGNTLYIETALLSLLFGFTFNSSANKAVARKEIILEEISSISTCAARAKLYPDTIRKRLTDNLKIYAETRARYFTVGDDEDKIKAELMKGDSIANLLIDEVAISSKNPNNGVYTYLMVPAINNMVDIAASREMKRTTRVPLATLKMLLLLSLIVSFLNGTHSKSFKDDWITAIGFSILVAMTLLLILDLDTPRSGLITNDKEQIKLLKLIKEL